jgi:ketosteroid isomerase-like protein
MSQEDVEIVRTAVEAWGAGDMDSFCASLDPDMVWNPVEEVASQGHAAVLATLARWRGEWDEYEQTAEEFVDIGDRVLATVHFQGRGRGSGIEIDQRFYEVYTVRNGKIVRMDEYTSRAEALEAAGLRE